jgi:hypothetical protein
MGARQYILGPSIDRRPFDGAEFFVRIAEDLRKAVVFLGDDTTTPDGAPDIDPKGTGFMIVWKSDSAFPFPEATDEWAGIYLVTAKHVAAYLKSHFAIRFNKKSGGSGIEPILNARWYPHPDNTVDAAVLHCGRPDWADCFLIPGSLLATPGESMKSDDMVPNSPDIGIGDITYVVGLFHLLRGKLVNLPVVHTGHIALLPQDEKIPVWDRIENKFQDVEGYLIEAHSLDGLSGAPVFARISFPIFAEYRPETDPPMRGGKQAGRMHSFTILLGMWQASWDGQPSDPLAKEKKIPLGRKVPVGFGVVVPAYKIAETLNLSELKMARRAEYNRRLKDNAAVTDSIESSESPRAPDANPNHLEDFSRLVDVAARKRPQGDQP